MRELAMWKMVLKMCIKIDHSLYISLQIMALDDFRGVL